MKDCLFCNEIINKKEEEREAYIIAENEGAIAILDKFPDSDGHTLLITKKCFPNIVEVDKESWEYLLPLLKKVVEKLQKAFPTIQGFNFISNMNEDIKKKIAYQSIPHLHVHIIPKYKPNEGFIWKNQPNLKYSLAQVAEKLK